jgi:hypothetical protein
MTGGGLATARRDAATRPGELGRSDRQRQEVAVSPSVRATDGSPATKHATELAVGRSACAVMNDQGSSVVEFDREIAESLLASGSFFWLDLGHPTGDDFRVLREVFRFHPLALEDSEQFDQRAKIDGTTTSSSSSSTVPDATTTGWWRCIAFTRNASLSPFIAKTARP